MKTVTFREGYYERIVSPAFTVLFGLLILRFEGFFRFVGVALFLFGIFRVIRSLFFSHRAIIDFESRTLILRGLNGINYRDDRIAQEDILRLVYLDGSLQETPDELVVETHSGAIYTCPAGLHRRAQQFWKTLFELTSKRLPIIQYEEKQNKSEEPTPNPPSD